MVHSLLHWLAPVALFAGALAAQAQTARPISRPDPLDPKASVPTPAYEPSFGTYRRMGDDKPVSWRDANDTVARIGGWRVYARESQPPEKARSARPTPSPSPSDTARPMPPGHGGHEMP